MSSSDSKRSKRRRNKRGGGNNRPVPASNANNTQPANAKADGQVLATIPVPSTLTELDLDNIPQPMSQMPRSHNPYLDREHCLLCRRERPDPPANRIPPGVGSEKENNRQLPITQMPLWLCPDCRRTVEEEEANSTKNFDPSAIGELLLPSTLPLITGLQNLDGAFSSSSGMGGDSSSVVTSTSGGKGGGSGGGGGGDGPCQCEPCRERREIAAEQEHSRQQLGECWTELSHLVRCVYWEAGTSLTGEESTTKLSLPRMKELVHRLCAHDPHLLYMRLEAEVEDFIKEMRERLLKQLEGGFRTPPLAKQFITMLLEEYAALCSAAQTLLAILEELEKEHLHKFNLTWPLHNKHLFHSLIYMEPGLHDNLGTLIKQLRAVASQKENYHEESYSNLLQRYLQFDNDMSVVAVVWRDCLQLIEDYTDEQELYKGKEALNRSWDTGVSTTRPRPLSCEATKTTNSRNLYQCHSALLNHMANGGGSPEVSTNHRGSTKKKCLCDDCSLNRLTSSLLTPDLYEEIGLKHLSEAAPGGQLSALDSYLQSINPPDLSSTTSSSECSSQGDSEEVIPIFSRSDLIHSGFCSPRSDDSDDSDDLDSESSPSPSHENAFDDEDDEGEGRQNETRGRARCRASYSGVGGERQSNGGGGEVKKDSNNSSSQPCECHVCVANNSSHLPAAAMMTANIGDTKPSYLFYPNLQSHQPLDLSHPGISAKHPLIHPHLYNLTSQKPNKIPNHSQQAFQLNLDASDGLQNYGDWNSAYESAKMVLHTHSHSHYGHEEAPDLIQSAKAAIQSNCRAAEKSENRSAKIVPVHQGHHNSDVKPPKEEKAKKHSHDGTGLISNGISEWTKQQRLAQHLHNEKSKNSSLVAQELCAKHNLPTVPKLPNNNLFFSPPLLQGSDATGGAVTQESLAQQFSSGVLTQQALMTQGMLAAQGAGLQLQNAGIHMADVHHLQQQHAPNDGKKKKKSLGGEDTLPAEPTVRLPDYLNEQHLHACSHQNQISHPSSVLGTNAGLCNSSMQTTASTPTSASVCSSEPDYETPNYQHDDDTPSNYDDKDSNASSTTRERESKHCECCYCEFFGQGPQPAPTSRNYTEIRDRLRLRLRERKQPKDHSPTHEPPAVIQPPTSDLLHADERKVEDLLSFIEGAKKTKSNSKAAKRQRQRQKKQAEQKTKVEPDNGHKKDIHVPVSLHHHHHHHHHHHMGVSGEKQHEATSQHNTNCKVQPPHPTKQLHQSPPKQQSQSLDIHQSESRSVPASKGQPRPQLDQNTSMTASQPSSTPMTTSSVSPFESSSKLASSNSRGVPTVSSLENVPKGESDSTSKKGKGSGATQPPVQASAPSSNAGNKILESKAKGKQNGAGKQGPSLAHPAEAHAESRGKADQEMGKLKRDQVAGNKPGTQPSQQRLAQNQKQLQQQQKSDKMSRHDTTNTWKTPTTGGQERLLNGNASDSSSGSSSRSNSIGNKSSNSRTKQGGAVSANIDDPHLKKQTTTKSSQGTTVSASSQGTLKAAATINTKKTNQTSSSSIKEQLPQKMEETATARLASKRSETNHKLETRTSQNGGGHEQMTNGLALSNGNSTTNKRRKKKKNSDNPNASIDEIFLPKENVDMNEMDETERELEAFKRFCMASTPQQHKEKVVFNVKDLALKKSSLQAH